MSAAQFVQVLENLSWRPKDRKKVQASDFEWMFISDDANKAFLSWICSHVTQKNLLTSEELEIMHELKSSGHYLQGKELEEALERAQVDPNIASASAIESLREEVASLESSYAATKEEVADLLRQREQLASQLAAVKSRNQGLQRVLQTKQDNFRRTSVAKVSQRNSILNETLQELSSAASMMASCYDSSEIEKRTLRDSFVSGLDATEYFEHEDICLQQARQFVKRRLASPTAIGENFDSNLVVSSESLDKGEDDLLHDHNLAFLRGVDAETHAKHCRELSRLQNIYAVSEKERLESEIELARSRASFETVKLQLMREQHYQTLDAASLKIKISDQKSQAAKERQLVTKQLQQQIPELIGQVAQLQTTPILWGDYNLKIARQRYKQHKIQRAISILLSQQARMSVLSYSLNAEAREFASSVANLMASCSVEMAKMRRDSKLRQRRMDDTLKASQAALPALRKGISVESVDLTDKSSLSFIRLLRLAMPAAASSGADAIELAHTLADKLRALKHQLAQLEQSQQGELGRSRQLVSQMVAKLFGSATTTTTPQLTPAAISDGQMRLEQVITELSGGMESLIKEHQQKLQSLNALPKERLVERQLWQAFFTNPASLSRLFRELDQR